MSWFGKFLAFEQGRIRQLYTRLRDHNRDNEREFKIRLVSPNQYTSPTSHIYVIDATVLD